MSRSCDEAWERRKAYLTRCLFNNVPYGVSPIREESAQSFTTSPRDGASGSSSVSPLVDTTAASVSRDVSEPRSVSPPVVGGGELDERAESPLPPLIIEPMPNKHDEPPEYYDALLIKMRRVYRKMFIENVDLSDDELMASDHEQSVVSDVDRAREESPSDSSHDSTNRQSMEFDLNVDDEQQTDNGGREGELVPGGEERGCDVDQQAKDMSTVTSSSEEAHFRQITTQAQVHADGSPPPHVRPSPVYEPTASQLSHREAHTCVRDPVSSRTHSQPSQEPAQHVHYTTLYSVSDDHIADTQVPESLRQSPLECQDIEEDFHVTSQRSKEPVREADEGDEEESGEVRVGESAQCGTFEDQAASTPPTRAPLRLARSSSPVLQPAVTRYRRPGDGALVERTAGRDHRTLPATSSSTSDQEPEVMRRHHAAPARHSLAHEVTRRSTDMELTCEHHTVPRDISSVTSQSQDGCLDTADAVSSRSVDNIVTSIFNKSSNKNEESSSRAGARKRSYKDISVQTEKYVKWEDLRANLFVGRPKVFKLCSCVGHTCS